MTWSGPHPQLHSYSRNTLKWHLLPFYSLSNSLKPHPIKRSAVYWPFSMWNEDSSSPVRGFKIRTIWLRRRRKQKTCQGLEEILENFTSPPKERGKSLNEEGKHLEVWVLLMQNFGEVCFYQLTFSHVHACVFCGQVPVCVCVICVYVFTSPLLQKYRCKHAYTRNLQQLTNFFFHLFAERAKQGIKVYTWTLTDTLSHTLPYTPTHSHTHAEGQIETARQTPPLPNMHTHTSWRAAKPHRKAARWQLDQG